MSRCRVVPRISGPCVAALVTLVCAGAPGTVFHTSAAAAAQPTVSFAAPANLSVGYRPWAVAVGDFNKDGKADVAVASRNYNTISVLLGNGDGSFGAPANLTVGSGPMALVVADLSIDGAPDLVAVTTALSNNVAVLLNDGHGGFAAAVKYGAGNQPTSVAVADFNKDARPDLAVANLFSNDVSILLQDTSGGFGPAASFAVGSRPWSVAGGDFNGDGKPDLVTTDSYDNHVSILLNTSAAGLSDTTAPTTTATRSPPANAACRSKAPVTVTLSTSDNAGGSGVASTQYKLQGVASWTAYAAPFAVSAQGTSTYEFRSTDKAGNVEASKTVSVRIDGKAPTTVAYAAKVKKGKKVRLAYKVSDSSPSCGKAAAVTLRIYKGKKLKKTLTLAGCSTNAKTTYTWRCTLQPGKYTIKVYAIDLAGNAQSKVGSARLTVQ